MISVGVQLICFYPPPPLSFHHQIRHLHYLLNLNLAPYIPPRRLNMQLVYVPVYTQTDLVNSYIGTLSPWSDSVLMHT